MGALTRGTGRRVYALEQFAEWAARVQGELDRLGFGHVGVILARLKESTPATEWGEATVAAPTFGPPEK